MKSDLKVNSLFERKFEKVCVFSINVAAHIFALWILEIDDVHPKNVIKDIVLSGKLD